MQQTRKVALIIVECISTQSCAMNIVLQPTKHKQKLRSELKRSHIETFIYLRPLYVKSMQSTITCAYVFFRVQMTFKYH